MADTIFSQLPPVPEVIDGIWQSESARITAGQTQVLAFPASIKEIIGQQGVDEIAKRFKNLIQSCVKVYQGGGFITMTQAQGTKVFNQNQQRPTPTGARGAKIPRPPNAFILYRQHHHPVIKGLYPEIHNNQISVILGQQWKNESFATKEHFISLAKQLKEKHIRENPQYAYQPRKPGDKKRRMTPKKAAKLQALAGSLVETNKTFNTITDESDEENFNVPALLPSFTTTDGGNLCFSLGDTQVNPNTLEAMVDSQNNLNLQRVIQANSATGVPPNAPPGTNPFNNVPAVAAFNDHRSIPIVSRGHDADVESEYLFNANAYKWDDFDHQVKHIDANWEEEFFNMDLAAANMVENEDPESNRPFPYTEVERQLKLDELFGLSPGTM